jgi:hypothetical protein
VVEAGGQGVKNVRKGDRVIAVPGWGGLVERLAVRAETVIPIPEAMSFEEAAALIMTYGTSYYALKDRAQLKPGETLLVQGGSSGISGIPADRHGDIFLADQDGFYIAHPILRAHHGACGTLHGSLRDRGDSGLRGHITADSDSRRVASIYDRHDRHKIIPFLKFDSETLFFHLGHILIGKL